jgi:hypothetical protein
MGMVGEQEKERTAAAARTERWTSELNEVQRRTDASPSHGCEDGIRCARRSSWPQ